MEPWEEPEVPDMSVSLRSRIKDLQLMLANGVDLEEVISLAVEPPEWSPVDRLADYVSRRHFPAFSASQREELVAIGRLKSLELLRKGEYDPRRAPLLNYLYTGMRNNMSHEVKRILREEPVDDFSQEQSPGLVVGEGQWLKSTEVAALAERVLGKERGKEAAQQVRAYLTAMGFDVRMPSHRVLPLLETDSRVPQRLVTMLIWGRLQQLR